MSFGIVSARAIVANDSARTAVNGGDASLDQPLCRHGLDIDLTAGLKPVCLRLAFLFISLFIVENLPMYAELLVFKRLIQYSHDEAHEVRLLCYSSKPRPCF